MKLAGSEVGLTRPMFLIAGPCVIESEQFAVDTAGLIREIGERQGITVIYKSSYDKANRSSGQSYRGPGIDEGLKILQAVKEKTGMPVLTDVHTVQEVSAAAKVVDVLQTPAFLCRQTDLIVAAAKSGLPVNIKKGQFLSPQEMQNVVAKAKNASDGDRVMVCERGYAFGYQNLVVDMRSLVILRETGCPVVFDATHSVQLPGGQRHASGGQREFIPALARAAVAVGVAGLFMETHPEPDKAPSDGPNAWPLDQLEQLVTALKQLDDQVKRNEMYKQ